MDDGQKREITACHNAILDAALRHLKNGDTDVIVFDEIFSAYSCGLLDEEKVHRVLSVPQTAEIVMTGRDPAEWILSGADYITEMRLVRHPYEKGISARRGIEF
jgi:cob(I)alamin adenosyltransferase